MSATHTQTPTIRDELDLGDPNTLGDIARKIKLGTMLSKVKVTFAALAAAAAHNITDAAHLAAATVVGLTLQDGEPLPPIGKVVTLRETAGGTAGPYQVTDAGGTAVVTTATYQGTALLSDDGKTITFPENTVTGFVLEYYPASAVAMSSTLAQAGPG